MSKFARAFGTKGVRGQGSFIEQQFSGGAKP
jgi:hypothetical protein